MCGPNVLAMTSPCDNAYALDRLADVVRQNVDMTAIYKRLGL